MSCWVANRLSRGVHASQLRETSLPVARPTIPQLSKLGRHRRVAPRQLLDRHVLRFVVCETQVAICAEQRFLGLLQVVDRFVDLVNGRLKTSVASS
jgi:hypothetical protein